MKLRKEIQALKDEFERQGKTVAEWADRSKVSASMIYQILSGEKLPTITIFEKLATALGLEVTLRGNGHRQRKTA